MPVYSLQVLNQVLQILNQGAARLAVKFMVKI